MQKNVKEWIKIERLLQRDNYNIQGGMVFMKRPKISNWVRNLGVKLITMGKSGNKSLIEIQTIPICFLRNSEKSSISEISVLLQ